MCHTQKIEFFGDLMENESFSGGVDGVFFGQEGRRIAILPDIYGLTDFYIGYASYLAKQGASVWLLNPWSGLGDDSNLSRDEAYVRRAKLKDNEYCDRVEKFLKDQQIDAVVGFCLGGNFAFELADRGYNGTNISIYPLPWGMDNQDKIRPAFEYMPTLNETVNILMGDADQLAGPENIKNLREITDQNNALTLNLYTGSNHGFFTDIDGDDEILKKNAHDAIDVVNDILFSGEQS